MRKPIAIAVADLHLRMKPPACRMDEPNWFEAMARPLRKIRGCAMLYDVPILCAGDIFDRWNSPPELINFAMSHMPHMIAIPGQHDIPNHSMDHINKSAFMTLYAADTIREIMYYASEDASPYLRMPQDAGPYLRMHGFPWGIPLRPLKKKLKRGVDIAVIHKYIWKAEVNKHKEATIDQHISNLEESLQGYDFAIFGDNHIPFTIIIGDCRVVNCGSMMIRKSSDNFRPRCWLLFNDESVEPIYLDSPEDVISKTTEEISPEMQQARDGRFDKMLEQLETLGTEAINFTEALMRSIDSYSAGVRKAILEIMEVGK